MESMMYQLFDDLQNLRVISRQQLGLLYILLISSKPLDGSFPSEGPKSR